MGQLGGQGDELGAEMVDFLLLRQDEVSDARRPRLPVRF
jgi:hypothetical protein